MTGLAIRTQPPAAAQTQAAMVTSLAQEAPGCTLNSPVWIRSRTSAHQNPRRPARGNWPSIYLGCRDGQPMLAFAAASTARQGCPASCPRCGLAALASATFLLWRIRQRDPFQAVASELCQAGRQPNAIGRWLPKRCKLPASQVKRLRGGFLRLEPLSLGV